MLGSRIRILIKMGIVSIVLVALGAITTPSALAYGLGTHDGTGFAAFEHAGFTVPSGWREGIDGYFSVPDSWLPWDVTNHYLFPPNWGNNPALGTAHVKVDADIAQYHLPFIGGDIGSIRNAMHYTADCGMPFHTTPEGERDINPRHDLFEGYAQSPTQWFTIPNYRSITSGDSTYSGYSNCVRQLAIETYPWYGWLNSEMQTNSNWMSSSTFAQRTQSILTNTMQHCNSIAIAAN